MRIAAYARVSTQRQTQMQTIDQQLERLQAHFQTQGWEWREDLVFRDDGVSRGESQTTRAGPLT
ncbi:MAG TPA: recombinase family protein [Ktedonobacteraceae bacterium]